jgi:hypothetical protein
MYKASFTGKDPGCIVFLLDRSDSMNQAWRGGSETMAAGAAASLNNVLLDLILKSMRGSGRAEYFFDIGIFGYGLRPVGGGEGVESAFGGKLKGQPLVPLPALQANPLAVRQVSSADPDGLASRVPVWVQPAHGYRTPMCQAIAVAGGHVYDWAAAHPNSFPPVIINITDGMVTDSPYEGADLDEWAKRLKGIQTSDGPVLLFNLFLSPAGDAGTLFPTSEFGLPQPGPELFRISSALPPPMFASAASKGIAVSAGARGFGFNADRPTLDTFMEITLGTSVEIGTREMARAQVPEGRWWRADERVGRQAGVGLDQWRYRDPTSSQPPATVGQAPATEPGAEATADEGSQGKWRYLKARCPERIPVGKSFSLLASIVLAGPASARLRPFDVPPEGRDVLLVVHAPGIRLLGDQRLTVHVPAESDSEPVMFELRADAPGRKPISITAWIGGNYLGELLIEIMAERDCPPGPHQEVVAEITTVSTEGAVTLVVRYDPAQKAYRFEFRDEDNPDEVLSNLAYDPGPLVEHLVADLDDLTKGRRGYSAAQTRDYLANAGAGLWRQLVPKALREQFWDRQHRIGQLTILSATDTVPWELLYPMDPGRAAGFLVEQFPVTRAIFGWRPVRTLQLRPTRFVLPEGSLPEARREIDVMRRLLDPGQPANEIISALTPLTDLIGSGDFGLLHFACHNTYDSVGGSSIKLGNVQFTPTLLEIAVIRKALGRSAPTVFINACRSAGLAATYNRLDGWASKFLEAGAAAFIGSLWAVSDGAAREFAQELYGKLQAGSPLGEAVMRARKVAAAQLDDPTWLAYTVYGNPHATVSPRP